MRLQLDSCGHVTRQRDHSGYRNDVVVIGNMPQDPVQDTSLVGNSSYSQSAVTVTLEASALQAVHTILQVDPTCSA